MAQGALGGWHPARLVATWFGSGLIPGAPGTWGSLAALPVAWLLVSLGGAPLLLAASVVVFVVGWWSTHVYLAASGEKDPGPVVIDEVAGQWLTLLWAPQVWWVYGLGFVFFRLADIFKPWPASWADRRVPGALGVMLDDILAAVYAAAALQAMIYFIGV